MKRTWKWILTVMTMLASVLAIGTGSAGAGKTLRTQMPIVRNYAPRRGNDARILVDGSAAAGSVTTCAEHTFTVYNGSDTNVALYRYVVAVMDDADVNEMPDAMWQSDWTDKNSFTYTFYETNKKYAIYAERKSGEGENDWVTWTYGGNTYTFVYTEFTTTAGEGPNLLTQKVNEAAAECNKGNDFDTAVAINDYLVKHVAYDYSFTYYSPEAALLNGTGVCNSYSRAYELIAEACGLNCKRVNGSVPSSNGKRDGHAWNVVMIDNEWYQIDTTWNDNGTGYHHLFLGLTDALMKISHGGLITGDGSCEPDFHYVDGTPVTCESLADNYFVHTGRWTDLVSRAANGGTSVMNQLQTALNDGTPGSNGAMEITADFGSIALLEGGNKITSDGEVLQINGTVAAYALSQGAMVRTADGQATPMAGTFTYSISDHALTGNMAPASGALSKASGSTGNLTWTLADGKLTISGRGDMTSHPWSLYATAITRAEIREGVTSICTGAFADGVNLESIWIPRSVEMIEEKAFSTACTKLAEVYYNGIEEDWSSGNIMGWGDPDNAVADYAHRTTHRTEKAEAIYVPTVSRVYNTENETLNTTEDGNGNSIYTIPSFRDVMIDYRSPNMTGYTTTYRIQRHYWTDVPMAPNTTDGGRQGDITQIEPLYGEELYFPIYLYTVYIPDDESDPILISDKNTLLFNATSIGPTGITLEASAGYTMVANPAEGTGYIMTVNVPEGFPTEQIYRWGLSVFDSETDDTIIVFGTDTDENATLQTGTNIFNVPQELLGAEKEYSTALWVYAAGYDRVEEEKNFTVYEGKTQIMPGDGQTQLLKGEPVIGSAGRTLDITRDNVITIRDVAGGYRYTLIIRTTGPTDQQTVYQYCKTATEADESGNIAFTIPASSASNPNRLEANRSYWAECMVDPAEGDDEHTGSINQWNFRTVEGTGDDSYDANIKLSSSISGYVPVNRVINVEVSLSEKAKRVPTAVAVYMGDQVEYRLFSSDDQPVIILMSGNMPWQEVLYARAYYGNLDEYQGEILWDELAWGNVSSVMVIMRFTSNGPAGPASIQCPGTVVRGDPLMIQVELGTNANEAHVNLVRSSGEEGEVPVFAEWINWEPGETTGCGTITIPTGELMPGSYVLYTDNSGEAYESSRVSQIFRVMGEDPYQYENKLILPEDLTTIEAEAFSHVDAETVIIPEHVSNIGSRAFAESGIQFVVIESGTATIAGDAFEECDLIAVFGHSEEIQAWAATQQAIYHQTGEENQE